MHSKTTYSPACVALPILTTALNSMRIMQIAQIFQQPQKTLSTKDIEKPTGP